MKQLLRQPCNCNFWSSIDRRKFFFLICPPSASQSSTFRGSSRSKMDKWAGKVAVVTGASAGIGRAVVEKLVAADVLTVGLARRMEKLNEIKEALPANNENFYPIQCDVTDEEQLLYTLKTIHEEIGQINVLVNNAGVISLGKVCEQSSDEIRRIFETNFIAVCNATREVVSLMRDSEIQGHIVLVNSTLGHYVPVFPEPTLGCYPASKYAITGLTEQLRQELNHYKSGIKVSSVSPGLTKSEIYQDKGDEMYEALQVALEAEDVADAIIYCLSTSPTAQVHEIILKPTGDPI